MTSKPESIRKEAIYAGQREAQGGKVAHAWIVNGNESWFSKPSGGVIGGVYTLRFSPDLTQVYTKDVVYERRRIDDNARIVAWELEHNDAVRRRANRAAERKHKANPLIDQAFEDLKHLVRGLNSPTEARVLANLISDRIIEEYWKGKM